MLAALSVPVLLVALSPVFRLFIVCVLPAEGGDLDDFPSKQDVNQFEAPTDEARVSEQSIDFLRMCTGRDVKVFRVDPEQQVAHSSSNQKGLEA